MSKTIVIVGSHFDSFKIMASGMILLFIVLLLSTPVLAQDCSPDIIVLAIQEDINNF